MTDVKPAGKSAKPVKAAVDGTSEPAKAVKAARKAEMAVELPAVASAEVAPAAVLAVSEVGAAPVVVCPEIAAAPEVDTVEAVADLSAPLPVPAMKETQMTTETPMKADSLVKPYETLVPAVEKATADMTAKMKEMLEKNMKSMTEMTEFAKGNVEALVESAKAAAAGAEMLTTHFVETSKTSMEDAQAAFKTMSSAKTPNELMAAQNEFAKAQFDKAVATMSHFSETWMKLAGDVVQPLSSRMALAGEQMKKTMAA